MAPTVYISLGSNIDPEKNLTEAARMLRGRWPRAHFSSVYRTAPRECTDQPDFLNAVAAFETDQPARDILQRLQGIERQLQKNPPFRFGPRTIDLDLLLYNGAIMEMPTLTIPHPRMHDRRFVLEPLSELMEMRGKHPVLNKTWTELLLATMDQACDKIELRL